MKTLFRIALLLGVLFLGIVVGRVAFATPLPCYASVERGHNAESDAVALRVCARVAYEAANAGLPMDLAIAVSRVESHHDPGALSPDGAVGPMQVLPRYHCPARWGRIRWCNYDDAVKAGARYLAQLVQRYGVEGGLARYRVGPRDYATKPERRATGERYAQRVLYVRDWIAHARAPREGRSDRSASEGMRLAPWARMHGAPPTEERER